MTQRHCHKLGVFISSVIFLIIMFYVFVLMKAIETKNMFRYPATMDCNATQQLFVHNGQTNMTEYQYYANVDKEPTVYKQGTGIYQCYCKSQGYLDLATNPECKTYVSQYSGGYALGELVTVVITVVNILIRTLVIFMIKKVGYWTVTGEITAIMVTVFIMTFFNTAVLLLLADANLSQITLLSWIPGVQKGPFPDLTEEWYIVIAPSLIFTMFLNACSPLIEIVSAVITGAIFKGLDQGFSNYMKCNPDKTTKCKTIQEYVNLYGGPPHVMSYKYSALMNTVCVTFMYGCALPELFPIAVLTFFFYYGVDKFLITYYYQKPPMYDDRLNYTSLELMKWAPLFLCFFGYWCMGNMQIFQAKLVQMQNQSIPITVEHNMWPSGNQALPLFITGCCIILGWIFTDLLMKCLTKVKIMEEDPEFIVDEHLGTYFECLSVWARKTWLAQEVHANQRLGIATMGSWTRDQLRCSTTHKNKVLKNAPNYEILSNDLYVEAFQFTPLERCDTPEEVAVSDTIMKVLYMGYTREGFQEFNFKKALHNKSWKKLKNKAQEQE